MAPPLPQLAGSGEEDLQDHRGDLQDYQDHRGNLQEYSDQYSNPPMHNNHFPSTKFALHNFQQSFNTNMFSNDHRSNCFQNNFNNGPQTRGG